jgi:hypothetical protein
VIDLTKSQVPSIVEAPEKLPAVEESDDEFDPDELADIIDQMEEEEEAKKKDEDEDLSISQNELNCMVMDSSSENLTSNQNELIRNKRIAYETSSFPN